MLFQLLPVRSVAHNTRTVNWLMWWFCLRFYAAVQVVYFEHVTGSLLLAASVLVAMQLAQGVFEVPTGILSDRWGRVWSLRLQIVASLIAVSLFMVGSYGWLLVGAIFNGLWRALLSGNAEALVYESAQESGHGGSFAHHLANFNLALELGGFLAVATGGFLAAAGFHWAFWATLAAQVVALALSWRLVEPTRHTRVLPPSPWGHFREALGLMRRNRVIRDLSLAKILTDGCSTFALWPAFYQTLMPLGLAGLMYSVNYGLSAVGFRASNWFMQRFAPMRTVFWGEVYARVLFLPALVFPTPFTPALMALAGAPYGPMTVALGQVLHDEYTDHQRATMASISSFLGNVVYGGFMLAMGAVADEWGVGRAIMAGQLCLLPVLWLYWRVMRSMSRG